MPEKFTYRKVNEQKFCLLLYLLFYSKLFLYIALYYACSQKLLVNCKLLEG